MTKHRFAIPVADKAGNVVGVRCNKCGKIVEFENHGQIPADILAEECTPEDASQAAARIVREATENK